MNKRKFMEDFSSIYETMLSYCLKCRKTVENPKDVFIEMCTV